MGTDFRKIIDNLPSILSAAALYSHYFALLEIIWQALDLALFIEQKHSIA